MKYYVFNLLAFSILFLSACNGCDQKNQTDGTTTSTSPQIPVNADASKDLIAQMEAEITKMQNLMPAFEANNEAMKSKRVEIKGSFTGGPETSTYEPLIKVYERAAENMGAYEGFRALTGKLISLSSDHSTGKVNASDAQKQFEEIQQKLQKNVDLLSRSKEELASIDADFKKVFSGTK